MSKTRDDFALFVTENTHAKSPPLVPEIILRLADEVLPLWQKIEAAGTANPPPPYWAFAWPGGQALARYILDHREEFQGRSLLDFGAGSGLVGIAAAQAGANAFAAEIDPISLAAIAMNASSNAARLTVLSDDVIGRDEGWDVICLGDMCYERPLAERIVPWIDALSRRGARVLLGDPGRNYFPSSGVQALATYKVPTSRDLEDRDMRETSVYLLQPA
ncbi:MAG: hypothetical protein RJB62_1838 [Pseudomonadota bacterium]